MGIDAFLSFLTGGTYAAAKYGSEGGKVLKFVDKTEDLIEFEDLKKILGKNAPKSFDEYKYLKYNSEKWEYIQNLKNYLIKHPDSNKKYFDAMVKLKEMDVNKGILLPPTKKQAFILPEGNYDSYHIMKRMQERNITDDDLRKLIGSAKCMVSQWNGKRQLFIGDEGSCIIVKQGDIWIYKTAWLKNDYDENMDIILEVLKDVGL